MRHPTPTITPSFRTTLLNGTIDSPFQAGTGISLVAQGTTKRPDYVDTRHRIERMTIRAGNLGIEIKGRNNVIRNSRLVIDGTAAIDSWGPGTIIENNVIEIRAGRHPDRTWRPAGLPRTDTAIRLLDADGTIIRNNTFRFVRGPDAGPHPAAIGLTLSRNVVIEGNRFDGFAAIVQKDDASSFEDRANRLDPGRPPREPGD